MKPVVVLVGRPNVGKSTLFNALTRTREALVWDEPGVTRDRQYGDGRVGDRPYFVVDTGGLGATDDRLRDYVTGQTRAALFEADAVVFVVDYTEGLAPLDRDIADELRRLGRPVTVAVNKCEGREGAGAVAEFHALGLGAPQPISAVHGMGIAALMDQVLAPLPRTEPEPEPAEGGTPRIAVVGRPNVGKSTLVNSLLGEERVVVADFPGTTRDSIRIPFERGDRSYVLIDTAGVRRRGRVDEVLEKFSVAKTLQAVAEANVVILVLDAQQEISEQDASLAGFVLEQGRALVVAVNKWDGLDESQRDWVKRELDRKLMFLSFAKPHFTSALRGTGVAALLPAVDRAFASARVSMPTPRLTRLLQQAVQATPPPLVRGRRPKLKFAHQGGRNPPRVVIHGNQVGAISDSYRRYLANVFLRSFKLEGTPVWIEFVQGENPYDRERPKVRTPRQVRTERRDRRIKKKAEARGARRRPAGD